MNKTNIEYCDYTWNPVTGCLHGCQYCYARKIVRRFSKDNERAEAAAEEYYKQNGISLFDAAEGMPAFPFGFAPTFYPHRLGDLQKVKKPSLVFVCSMADLFGSWLPESIITKILVALGKASQHTFLLLTKNPGRLNDFIYPDNCLVGATATNQKQWDRAIEALYDLKLRNTRVYISAEPILKKISPHDVSWLDWLILGGLSGGKIDNCSAVCVTVDRMLQKAADYSVPVFMKSNLPCLWDKPKKQKPSLIRVKAG